MQRRDFLKLSLLAPLAYRVDLARALPAPIETAPDGKPHAFGFRDRHFVMDGHAFQIRSGQMDPIRIPREHWRNRVRMARAMGLNTIALYVMWNALEAEPGRFDLTGGRRDFARFIDICGEEGMWVYLRPGPYVCAEWDFGGLPAWLLRDAGIRVRDAHDARYMQAVARYFDAVAPAVRARMTAHGGPILMLQIENEYASFGTDVGYLDTLRQMWCARGIDGPFSISDGLPQLQKAHTYVAGTALGLDGGTDFAAAQVIAREAPVWVGEGYTGWLSHWGDAGWQHSDYAGTLRKLMVAGRSFNLYEVHGGTSFGFGAGANADNDGSDFKADLTSYDYGAPIDERGVPTAAFHRCRAAIQSALPGAARTVPEPPPVMEFAAVNAVPWASLWDNLPTPRAVAAPRANELLTGEIHGIVVYRKRVNVHGGERLRITGVHDFASVLINGRPLGVISRVRGKGLPAGDTLTLPHNISGNVELDIVIDSFGHVGYGEYMRDRKGLTGAAYLDDATLTGWDVCSLPLDAAYIGKLRTGLLPPARPCVFFRADVELPRAADTYIDLSAWDKGYAWVNGHLLGRYWHIGPQQRLYCPAGWWRAGHNDVLVFDQLRTTPAPLRGVATLHA